MAIGIKHQLIRLTDKIRILNNGESFPIWHYHGTKNVGDLLNQTLIPRLISGKVVPIKTEDFFHLRAIGSILDHAPKRSVTWGSGLINPKAPSISLNPDSIKAVRGHLTRNIVEESLGAYSLPVGDPAVLSFENKYAHLKKIYELGIVAHYVDVEILKKIKNLPPEICIIDVSLSPHQFIKKLNQCKAIISSSLHGLILSDTYHIPNCWVRFSDRLKGGTFKFHDYYSTTSERNKSYIDVSDPNRIINDLNLLVKTCTVSSFIESKAELLSAFPSRKEFARLSLIL